MVQRRVPGDVGRVQRAVVLEEQVHHGDGAHGSGPVQRVLAARVPDPRGRRRLALQQLARHLDVVLGRHEMHNRLHQECQLRRIQLSPLTTHCRKGGGQAMRPVDVMNPLRNVPVHCYL